MYFPVSDSLISPLIHEYMTCHIKVLNTECGSVNKCGYDNRMAWIWLNARHEPPWPVNLEILRPVFPPDLHSHLTRSWEPITISHANVKLLYTSLFPWTRICASIFIMFLVKCLHTAAQSDKTATYYINYELIRIYVKEDLIVYTLLPMHNYSDDFCKLCKISLLYVWIRGFRQLNPFPRVFRNFLFEVLK